MRQETITVYRFDELPTDKAKERARDWWREAARDDEFWDYVYEDCAAIFRILGIDSRRVVKLRDGTMAERGPEIYFRGFWSQGDGACFVGRYSYAKGARKAIRAHAPTDETLHDIADRLQALQRKHFYGVEAKMSHRDMYYHEYSIDFEVWDRDRDASEETHNELRDIMRDLMRWIYNQLEEAHDSYFSDEHVEDAIVANEYEFEEDGSLHN